MRRQRRRNSEDGCLRDNWQSALEKIADHEDRIRALENYQARLLGALAFVAVEIPVVGAIIHFVMHQLTR